MRDAAEDQFRFSRRQLLQLPGLAACAYGLAGGASDDPDPVTIPPGNPANLLIDPHCHVFNAADLPIFGFVSQVVLDSDERPSREVLEPLIRWIAVIMKRGAPSPSAELQWLENGAPFTAVESFSPEQVLQDGLRRILVEFEDVSDMGPSSSVASQPTARTSYLAGRAKLIEIVLAGTGFSATRSLLDGRAPDAAIRGLAASLLAGERAARAEAFGISDSFRIVRQYLIWATKFVRYRTQSVLEYARLYGPTLNGVQVITPALIDYDLWLGDASAAQADQIAVMSAIARRQPGGLAVHPFAAFDPWRDGREGGAVLERVQNAVRQGGFAGVKLYPPMGFRAVGNVHESAWPAGVDPRAIDAALQALYAWCVREDVPILAHCADSNVPRAEYRGRAAPQYWRQVLDQHRTLRLNFGHFGGLWHDHDPAWAREVLSILGSERYPHAYADFGDTSFVLGRTPAERRTMDAVRALLKEAMASRPQISDRLLYASDWIMLGREYGHEGYLNAWDGAMREIAGPDALSGFLGGNAATYSASHPAKATALG